MKNAYLTRVQMYRELETLRMQRFTRQLCGDLFTIALNRCGFGKDRIRKIMETYDKIQLEFAGIWNADEPSTEYSKDLVDRSLRQIFGDDFIPWEVRYKF